MFFGATGDLAYKMIFPALCQMVKRRTLAVPVVGVASSGWGLPQLPFGRDLASARQLNRVVRSAFPEPAIFRIDHFLGREEIMNLLYFRFARSFLEPIWNRNYVASVRSPWAEQIRGAGSRCLL